MPNELLPIRVFRPRENDDWRIEGGGGDPPKWVLSGDELILHAGSLHTQTLDCLSVKHNVSLPYAVDVKLKDDATAKSRRKYVVDMLVTSSSTKVVGMSGDRDLVVSVPAAQELQDIATRIEDSGRYDLALSCIDSISPFEPEVVIKEDIAKYKLKLIPQDTDTEMLRVKQMLQQELTNLGIEWELHQYAHDLEIFSVKASADEALAIADGSLSEAIFSIRPMPQYAAVLDELALPQRVDFVPRDPYRAYPVVGILDSGIKPIAPVSQWLSGERWSAYIDADLDTSHALAVASTVIYGDALEKKPLVGENGVEVFDAAIIPSTPIDETELIDNIKRAVKLRHDDVKVWNLSVSMSYEVEDGSFSDLGVALDSLEDDYGVLIVKSAGNHTSFARAPISDRIVAGADSLRSLTVGSTAGNRGPHDIADVDDPSPFTRVGPGPAHVIKPEVSHYGGNAHVENGRVIATGVKVVMKDGGIGETAGTSFSTPRIAALASHLQFSLADKFDPLLVKALIVHSAKFPEGNSLANDEERVRYYGYGIPGDVQEILFNKESESTLVLRGTLEKGKAIDIMDFPMPKSLIKDGRYTGLVTVTCVSAPILDQSEGAEYSQSDVGVLLGTYASKFDRGIDRSNILNAIGRSGSENLLKRSLYSKRAMRNANGAFALRERVLVEHGKYSPVKKYAVNLSELTDANLSKIAEDRLWYMRVEGVYRDKKEREALANGEVLQQEYCVIITVRDPDDTAPVYDEMVHGLDANNFWQNSINLSSNINIHV